MVLLFLLFVFRASSKCWSSSFSRRRQSRQSRLFLLFFVFRASSKSKCFWSSSFSRRQSRRRLCAKSTTMPTTSAIAFVFSSWYSRFTASLHSFSLSLFKKVSARLSSSSKNSCKYKEGGGVTTAGTFASSGRQHNTNTTVSPVCEECSEEKVPPLSKKGMKTPKP